MKTLDHLIRLASPGSKRTAYLPVAISEILTYEAELDVVERFLKCQEARWAHPSAQSERESMLIG
jgi:hypothetical protein